MFKENKSYKTPELFSVKNTLFENLQKKYEKNREKKFYKNVFCKIDKIKFIVKLIYLHKSSNDNLISIYRFSVPFTKTHMTIYDIVDFFKEEFVNKKIKAVDQRVMDKIQLKNIINLHNSSGIKSIFQINDMVLQIKSGKEILSPSEISNIKLVKTTREEMVLFDGHHSMLAYMAAGRKYLNEIPHLIVEDGKNECVSDEEILVFFGKHSTKIKASTWREYVINWQAPEQKQLCKSVQKNMGELLDSLDLTLQEF